MMGIEPSHKQPSLFSYHINLEPRIPADHLLRQVLAVLDLSFVLPTVRHLYGRSGNVSLDPRLILKLMLLLFLYNIGSERELMEQIGVRLDFLWFLGFDLDSEIPDHSVLSKARARWGEEVFEQLFVRMVKQCVEAGLVNGSLLHVDSTIVKASASKDSVVTSSPELVSALRQAYQQQQSKLEPTESQDCPAAAGPCLQTPAGQATATLSAPTPQPEPTTSATQPQAHVPSASAADNPGLRVVPSVSVVPLQQTDKASSKKLPVNSTHISTTDPEAELARNKSGVTELNYKEHRLVDDAHGVITALR